jgi:hypothetical protein
MFRAVLACYHALVCAISHLVCSSVSRGLLLPAYNLGQLLFLTNQREDLLLMHGTVLTRAPHTGWQISLQDADDVRNAETKMGPNV